MSLHQPYNNENILSRSIIGGLLNIFNNQINYEQVWSAETSETINVPVYYNMAGDEKFMQNFYTHYADCVPPTSIDGNFDVIPRGVITYLGSVIDPVRITSRFVQGSYLKEVDGQLQTYRSFLYYIPLNVNFDCEFWLDTQVTALKVEQVIREVFYKTITFYVYYKGMRIGCSVGFPEDYTLEKNIQYSFETDNKIKLKFSLQVEAYQPVFDPTTEVNANQYMTGLGYRLWTNDERNDGIITITTPTSGTDTSALVIPKGYQLLLEWEYKHEAGNINRVDVLWANSGETDKNVVERLVPNHEYYLWNIPETFTDYKHPSIVWCEDSSISIYRQPIIRILPDVCTNQIKASSFYIVDEGYFLSNTPDTSIRIILEMKNDNNRVVFSGDASIYINIVGNKINEDDPVTFDGSVYFPGTVDYKVVDIYIANSVDNDIYDKVENVMII